MALKYIVLASFAITGTLFYVSKGGSAQKSARLSLAEAVLPDPPVMPEAKTAVKRVKNIPKDVVEAPPQDLRYASLLPIREGSAPASRRARDDEFRLSVQSTIRACVSELIKKRKAIWEARDGDTDLSFDAELTIQVEFKESEVTALQSRSDLIRDDRFHHCIEDGAKSWKFPADVSSQNQWVYRRRIAYDVTYKRDCEDDVLVAPLAGSYRNCF